MTAAGAAVTACGSAYVGGELEVFAHARNWKAYWSRTLAPFIRGDVLEVGAGIGANTLATRHLASGRWTCLEPDARLAGQLARTTTTAGLGGSVQVVAGTTAATTDGEFDTVLYLDVLEHLADDRVELDRATALLRPGGHLAVLAPAHQALYSEFDRAIGHHRRYKQSTLLALAPAGCTPVLARYLDSVGLLLSACNRFALRQKAPSLRQILFWDRSVIPLSCRLDPWLGYRLGKSVVVVWHRARS